MFLYATVTEYPLVTRGIQIRRQRCRDFCCKRGAGVTRGESQASVPKPKHSLRFRSCTARLSLDRRRKRFEPDEDSH